MIGRCTFCDKRQTRVKKVNGTDVGTAYLCRSCLDDLPKVQSLKRRG